MPRGRPSGDQLRGPRSADDLVSQVRFNVNWQWPAIKMQYERLITRSRLPQERLIVEYMQMVADMDFLVTSVRRLLRTAELARRIPSECQPQLRLALRIFKSRWGSLTAVRDAIEHSDGQGEFPVPSVGIPMSGHGDSEFTFMWTGGNIDLGKMYEAARSVLKAVLSVIESLEPGRDGG